MFLKRHGQAYGVWKCLEETWLGALSQEEETGKDFIYLFLCEIIFVD